MPWRPVLTLAAATTALLLAVASRYGWHRDELYFLEAGRHLAWGYVDQPPFTPFVARVADELAPGNLVVLRTLPAAFVALTVLLGALLVRELGGGARAQVLGAGVMASSGFVLGSGHLLSTATFDLGAWMALLVLAAHLLRTGEPRWWAPFGAVMGLAMHNKNLPVLLALALGAGIVAGRRWRLLTSPWLAAGAGLALALASPNLLWQAQHGWPQLDMAEALSERLAGENRLLLVPLQLLFLGPLLVLLLVRGTRSLWTAARFRPLVLAWPAGLLLTFATGGRPYYAFPLTLAVALAGVAATPADSGPGRRLPWLVAAGAAVSIPLALPVLPMEATPVAAAANEAVAETVGWPELVHQLATVVESLPAEEREDVVLLTGSYGEAGAIDRFGPALGLPPAYSPHNGYADFRRPTDERATVVAVRFPLPRLQPHFERCEQVAAVDNGLDIDNEVQGQPILVCRGLRDTWDATWEELRFLS